MEQETDADLVRRFHHGDHAAFEMLVRRHQDRIYRLAGLYLYSPQEAEDVAQEVFLRAFKGLGRFRFGAQPFTWLYRTLRNVCHEHNRRSRCDNSDAMDPDELPAAGCSETLFEVTRQAVEIRNLVAELPKRQREVVLLRIFEEMPVEETAAIMGCRPGTVKAQLHKAMQNLRSRKLPGGNEHE